MKRTVHVDLCANTCFMTRRYEKPESWAKIVRQLGFDYASFDSDALDPFYSGDRDYVLRTAGAIRETFEDAGIKIVDYLTGVAPYRFFGLAHSNPEARNKMYEWLEGAIDIASVLGAESVSGRFDAFSVEVLNDPEAYKARYLDVIRAYRRLSERAKECGLTAIGIEQMYVPSLVPYTIDGSKRYFADANTGNGGAFIRPVVDTGHACGQNYGTAGDDLYYEKWLEEFGVFCNTIHIQQSRRRSSDHAPFTPENKGDVTVYGILESLEKSAKNYARSNLAPLISVPDHIYLILEAIPSTSQTEEKVFDDLRVSMDYLRTTIPGGGIDLTIE